MAAHAFAAMRQRLPARGRKQVRLEFFSRVMRPHFDLFMLR